MARPKLLVDRSDVASPFSLFAFFLSPYLTFKSFARQALEYFDPSALLLKSLDHVVFFGPLLALTSPPFISQRDRLDPRQTRAGSVEALTC